MNGYSVEQRRTFGRVKKYLVSKGIADKSWQDVAIDEDGTFIEWPTFFPEDEGPSDVEATEADDDTAEQAAEEEGIETALRNPRTPMEVLIRCLIDELPTAKRRTVLAKAGGLLKSRHSVTQTRNRNNASN